MKEKDLKIAGIREQLETVSAAYASYKLRCSLPPRQMKTVTKAIAATAIATTAAATATATTTTTTTTTTVATTAVAGRARGGPLIQGTTRRRLIEASRGANVVAPEHQPHARAVLHERADTAAGLSNVHTALAKEGILEQLLDMPEIRRKLAREAVQSVQAH
eukprot:6207960-Pleurochrysis_carterae.AAC.3